MFVEHVKMKLGPRPDFGENVRGGGKIFRGGATMISPSLQRVKIKKPYFNDFYIIMSASYTFLSSLYNCLLKFISLIILLGEVRKFLEEVLKISGEVRAVQTPVISSPAPAVKTPAPARTF